MRRGKHQQLGAILTTLTLFALVLIFMVLIAIPVVKNSRSDNHARACIENLEEILAAKEKYATLHDLKYGAKIEISDLLKGNPPLIKTPPVCQDHGEYTLGPLGTLPTCSISGHELPMAAALRAKAAAAPAAPAPSPTPAAK